MKWKNNYLEIAIIKLIIHYSVSNVRNECKKSTIGKIMFDIYDWYTGIDLDFIEQIKNDCSCVCSIIFLFVHINEKKTENSWTGRLFVMFE